MAINIRVPLEDAVLSRDASVSKDSIAVNCFTDSSPIEGSIIVKRPGLQNLTSALGLGIAGALGWGRGIFYYDGKLFSWNGPDLGIFWAGFAKAADKLVLIGAAISGTIFGQSFYVNTEDELKLGNKFGSFSGDGQFTSILHNGTKFFALNSNVTNKFISESLDGITWTVTSTFVPGGTFSLAAVKGTTLIFVDSTRENVIRSVDNGITWSLASTGLLAGEVLDIAVLGTRFSIGSAHSSDGITWTNSTGTATGMKVIASNNSVLIGFPTNSNIYKFSNNGTTWSDISKLGSGAASMTNQMRLIWSSSLSRWVGICSNGKSVTSTDGTNWTLGNRNESIYLKLQSLVTFNNAFYCYSYLPPDTVGNPYQLSFIEKSLDGVNWTSSAVDLAFDNEIPTIINGII